MRKIKIIIAFIVCSNISQILFCQEKSRIVQIIEEKVQQGQSLYTCQLMDGAFKLNNKTTGKVWNAKISSTVAFEKFDSNTDLISINLEFNNEKIELNFLRNYMHSKNAKMYSKGTKQDTVNIPNFLCYRGYTANNLMDATFCIDENRFALRFTHKKENYIVRKEKSDSKELVLTKLSKGEDIFLCGLDETKSSTERISFSENLQPSINSNIALGCVDIYLEADFASFQHYNSDINELVWHMGNMFNHVSIGYLNANINIAISDYHVWTSVDPYNGNSNMSSILNNFSDWLEDNYIGDAAFLILGETRGSTKGIANGGHLNPKIGEDHNSWNNDGPYGIVAEFNFYNDANFDQSRIPFVFAHELGHLFGLGHTFECLWSHNGNSPVMLSNCGNITETCTNINLGPSIMSYCFDNININFHQPAIDVMSALSNAISNNIDGICPCSAVNTINLPQSIFGGITYPIEGLYQASNQINIIGGTNVLNNTTHVLAGNKIEITANAGVPSVLQNRIYLAAGTPCDLSVFEFDNTEDENK